MFAQTHADCVVWTAQAKWWLFQGRYDHRRIMETWSLGGGIMETCSLGGSIVDTWSLGGSIVDTWSLGGSIVDTWSLGGNIVEGEIEYSREKWSLGDSIVEKWSLDGSIAHHILPAAHNFGVITKMFLNSHMKYTHLSSIVLKAGHQISILH